MEADAVFVLLNTQKWAFEEEKDEDQRT